ncbi:helix-turn-helix domain-containing protein [Phenylobacterium sp.]|uniref:helix-turn-helix domain-containing protein n=1 Tax=Phenylobacterium sp. TaxID=1871053 RepID=UPI0025CDC57A|nr:helix-turn-helix domain-containing protein [Phenylobacterium sp.]
MGEVSVRFLPPAPALGDAVIFYYVVRNDGARPVEDLLHPEGAYLRLLLAGDWRIAFADGATHAAAGPHAVMTGALSRAARVWGGPGAVMVSAGLLPAGWPLLSDAAAAGYVDRLHPLSEVLGEAAAALLEAVAAAGGDAGYAAALDAWLLRRLEARAPLDATLVELHVALNDPEVASVADWAGRLGLSTRQLERLTRDYIGLPPKLLMRRQRFLRSSANLRAAPLGEWARVLDERYADQPQFVRDFKHFMGMAPRAYFARPTPLTTAAAAARKATETA